MDVFGKKNKNFVASKLLHIIGLLHRCKSCKQGTKGLDTSRHIATPKSNIPVLTCSLSLLFVSVVKKKKKQAVCEGRQMSNRVSETVQLHHGLGNINYPNFQFCKTLKCTMNGTGLCPF